MIGAVLLPSREVITERIDVARLGASSRVILTMNVGMYTPHPAVGVSLSQVYKGLPS
jgi:hypothetical protein